MELLEAIRTTRAMRRLHHDRPVPEADIWAILEAASKAATGGNSQPVRWVVVTDAEKRRRLGAIYKECWLPVSQMYQDHFAKTDAGEGGTKLLGSADHLGEHMGDAPVIIIPTSKGGDASSVFPGVQNLLLAARERGLGTTLTTVHRRKEDEVRAVLDIPEDVNTWAMIPVGYPTGRWGEAERRPVEELTYWDAWGESRPRTAEG